MAAKKKVTIPAVAAKKPITFKKGGLHKSTGTPAGTKIPAKKLAAAASGKLGAKAAKQAQLAKNLRAMSKKKGKK